MVYRNGEGYTDMVAGRAIKNADQPPENVRNFRRAMKLMMACLEFSMNHMEIVQKETQEGT